MGKSILSFNNEEAQRYFLMSENYSTLELPRYFDFDAIIKQATSMCRGKTLQQLVKNSNLKDYGPWNFENVNYHMFNNKRAKYSWRKIELIHPILYVDLVNIITQKENWDFIKARFNEFASNKKIICCSLPISNNNKRETILNWWNSFEQRSIACGLDYMYLGKTDIESCYPSIYTHSIAWALNTKESAKLDHSDKLLGNVIDKRIQGMQYGQTNGIPQGSVLMDFIAEMVLGYGDQLLSKRLKNADFDYKILRYRDDYRIFARDVSSVKTIVRELAEVLSELNLNINANKTSIGDDIVLDSIKPDKRYRISVAPDTGQSLQRKLMDIYDISKKFPDSGIIKRELAQLYKQYFSNMTHRPNSYEQIISIIVELMRNNPSAIGICSAMIGTLLSRLSENAKKRYIERIYLKFVEEPFSDYLDIWMQRITLVDDRDHAYNCTLCRKIYEDISLWNSDWLNHQLDESVIVNKDKLNNISPVMTAEEVDSFTLGYDM